MNLSTTIKLRVETRQMLADTFTPVSVYLRVRDQFRETVLLESTDFRSVENCFSFIGVEPIAKFLAQGKSITTILPNSEKEVQSVDFQAVLPLFKAFVTKFDIETPPSVLNGFLGHTSFDAVQYFDTVRFDPEKRKMDLPDLHYSLYRFLIAFNHFKDEITILENIPEGETSQMERLQSILNLQTFPNFRFTLQGNEDSNLTDEAFKTLVTKGKHHCQIGDVFQIVLSRQFSQSFQGDDFQVYRALRSVNPSPYLFYFDYGSYKIFGSSPEQQLVVKNGIAGVNPIAGTYRRTGDDAQDTERAIALAKDPKENAEHIMLVDLARNDLGKHSKKVTIKTLKEIQYFSHVIHLVSKVEGELADGANAVDLYADTFPAGTLSGAPKYKAMKLIDLYENQNRHFYGGGIGFIGLDGSLTHAIIIRSFLSKDNVLYSQAGAGIVVSSNEESELAEVNHKLGALKQALRFAEKL
jgi:anthranilate synthase component 1